MSNTDTTGFGKFVPGFDFLQNLTKGASQNIPHMPNLAHWIAPTLSVEELDKRIEELKNVHFWLEQNSRALGATIQALEVQKMTLVTLQGMNFNLGDMANVLKPKAVDSVTQTTPEATSSASKGEAKDGGKGVTQGAAKPLGVPGLVDPLQLWGALAQQFQAIAATAMQEASTKTAADMGNTTATGPAKDALKPVTATGRKAAAKRPAARTTAAKKSTGR